MRVVLVVVFAAACGRVGFDGSRDATGGGDGTAPDVPTSCVGDGFCVASCGATDPDCQTACGDGMCVGNAGETCKTCTADCRTTQNVCGNGTCGDQENGNNCFVDCGPVPWTWGAEEEDLMARINAARTGGTACGGGAPTTAPALNGDITLRAAAHDLAWEQARYGLLLTRCDGQGTVSYLAQVGASGSKLATSNTSTTNAQRMADWLADSNACMTLMTQSFTRMGVGIAVDANNGYVALFK